MKEWGLFENQLDPNYLTDKEANIGFSDKKLTREEYVFPKDLEIDLRLLDDVRKELFQARSSNIDPKTLLQDYVNANSAPKVAMLLELNQAPNSHQDLSDWVEIIFTQPELAQVREIQTLLFTHAVKNKNKDKNLLEIILQKYKQNKILLEFDSISLTISYYKKFISSKLELIRSNREIDVEDIIKITEILPVLSNLVVSSLKDQNVETTALLTSPIRIIEDLIEVSLYRTDLNSKIASSLSDYLFTITPALSFSRGMDDQYISAEIITRILLLRQENLDVKNGTIFLELDQIMDLVDLLGQMPEDLFQNLAPQFETYVTSGLQTFGTKLGYKFISDRESLVEFYAIALEEQNPEIKEHYLCLISQLCINSSVFDILVHLNKHSLTQNNSRIKELVSRGMIMMKILHSDLSHTRNELGQSQDKIMATLDTLRSRLSKEEYDIYKTLVHLSSKDYRTGIDFFTAKVLRNLIDRAQRARVLGFYEAKIVNEVQPENFQEKLFSIVEEIVNQHITFEELVYSYNAVFGGPDHPDKKDLFKRTELETHVGLLKEGDVGSFFQEDDRIRKE